MRILHLSTDDVRGGAARAANRLHRSLVRLGHDSRMLVLHKRTADAEVSAYQPPAGALRRLLRRWRKAQIARAFAPYRNTRPEGNEHFSDDRSEHAGELARCLPDGGIVHLHWISRFVDQSVFLPAAAARGPAVWTLHDLNAFTGGCHYGRGCTRYLTGCGACPQIGSREPDDLSRRIWERRRAAYAQIQPGRLHLVAPSRWMASVVQSSPLLGRFPVTVIPNGVDTDDFAPRDKGFAREVLGVPLDARVVLFAAESLSNRRKGLEYLIEAVAGLGAADGPPPLIVTVGRGAPERRAGPPAPASLSLPFVDDDRILSLVYSAADVLALPSLEENASLTAVEALACGLPVAGFAVGGVPETVVPEVTGLLAAAQDAAGLGRAIARLLGDEPLRAALAANCRNAAVAEYSLETMARRYAECYQAAANGSA